MSSFNPSGSSGFEETDNDFNLSSDSSDSGDNEFLSNKDTFPHDTVIGTKSSGSDSDSFFPKKMCEESNSLRLSPSESDYMPQYIVSPTYGYGSSVDKESDGNSGSDSDNSNTHWSPTKGFSKNSSSRTKTSSKSSESDSFRRDSDSFDMTVCQTYSPTKGYTASSSLPLSKEKHKSRKRKNNFPEHDPVAKNFKIEEPDYVGSLDRPIQGGIGASIMERMGYKKGEGLGKNKQGRLAPIELSKQRGRRGFGLSIPNLDRIKWQPEMEVIEVKEVISWLECSDVDVLNIDVLRDWMHEGPKDLQIEQMHEFCDPDLLRNVLNCKSIFDSMEKEKFLSARTRSNPFERIKGGIFINRAAMKMANIDAVFDFMFTNPTDLHGKHLVGEDKLLYFADVCAGPGGFSEYVLWKKKWRAKGFGFTLKGDCDFKLDDFYAGPCETFETYYGGKNDGNVFDPDNITDLTNLVMSSTHNMGVHFMMADGGFSVDGQENIQELLSKQLYLCQFLVALSIVRTGGHFICKLFDLFSPFSVGLVYLMYRAFHAICIFKPNTSRPANSERYIVCKYKRDDSDDIRNYMFEINEKLQELGLKSATDITHCVPSDILQNDTNFFNYIVTSNNVLGERQVVNLAKIAHFYDNPNVYESKQSDLRHQCLQLWRIPDVMRKAEEKTAEEVFMALFRVPSKSADFLSKQPIRLIPDNLENAINTSVYDWNCIVLGAQNPSELCYFLGTGRNRVSKWEFSKKNWTLVKNCGFELSPGTLLLGEIVTEITMSGRIQHKRSCLHIIDAFTLGKEDISSKHYLERLKMCELFTGALDKKSDPSRHNLRVIKPISLENIAHIFDSLIFCRLKSDAPSLIVNIDDISFKPKGILFFSSTKEPWVRHKSRKTGYYYFSSPKVKESLYEMHRPQEAVATFRDCCCKQVLWIWEEGVGFMNEDPKGGVLHKNQLLEFVQQKTARS